MFWLTNSSIRCVLTALQSTVFPDSSSFKGVVSWTVINNWSGGAFEVICSLKNSLLTKIRKTKTQESGVTLPSPSISSISRSRNQHQKAHVSPSFICLFMLSKYGQWFYKTPGMKVKLRFTAMGSANRVIAGQTHNVKRIEGVSVPLAWRKKQCFFSAISVDDLPSLFTCCLDSSQQPFLL